MLVRQWLTGSVFFASLTFFSLPCLADAPAADPRPPGSEEAPPPAPRRFELAVGAGPAFAFGESAPGQSLAGEVGTPIALTAEGGYRLDEITTLSLYSALALGLRHPESCPAGYSCPPPSGLFTLGIGPRFHLLRGENTSLWVGGGAGFGLLQVTGQRTVPQDCILCFGNGTVYHQSIFRYGWELSLDVGADLRLTGRISLGIALAAHLGFYTQSKVNSDDPQPTPAPTGTGKHEWITIGPRLLFDL